MAKMSEPPELVCGEVEFGQALLHTVMCCRKTCASISQVDRIRKAAYNYLNHSSDFGCVKETKKHGMEQVCFIHIFKTILFIHLFRTWHRQIRTLTLPKDMIIRLVRIRILGERRNV